MARIRIHGKRLLVASISALTILFYTLLRTTSQEDEPIPIILSPSHLVCQHPKLEVYGDKMTPKYDPLDCTIEKDWVTVTGSVAKISEEAIQLHGIVDCQYTELIRIDDDTTKLGDIITTNKEFTFTSSDFFQVSCNASDGKRWASVLAGIREDEGIKESLGWHLLPEEAIKCNVLVLGLHSLSQVAFKRILPKTHKFLLSDLGSHILQGYNAVGDGLPQALIPILTGRGELELPEVRKRMGKKSQFVDIYPFIWKKFQQNGYATLYSEDQPHMGTFNLRLKGFNDTPTHHYARPLYNYIYPRFSDHPKYCLNGIPRHKVFLNYVQDFFTIYKDFPKFTFAMHGELSEDDPNLLSIADEDIFATLSHLKKQKHLDNTILIMFSDHGHRKVNSERLTTAFDLHSTLVDVTNFHGAKLGMSRDRAISLFSEVPTTRSCKDASIEDHWCACLSWDPLATNDDRVMEAGQALLNYINTHTAPRRSFCHEFKLKEIAWAALQLPNEALLRMKGTADTDGYLPDLSADVRIRTEVYQITVKLLPTASYSTTLAGTPLFEASLSYDVAQDSFSVRIDDISRLNPSEEQSYCVLNLYPNLNKFCYCRQEQVKI